MPNDPSRDWYETPRYYDIVFDRGTAEEVDFLETALREHGPRNGWRVLEPACGTGRLSVEFARRGYDVTGFDDSPSMLAYAKRRSRNLPVRLFRDQLERFRVPGRFDLVHCLLGSFKYLLTERGQEDQRYAKMYHRPLARQLTSTTGEILWASR